MALGQNYVDRSPGYCRCSTGKPGNGKLGSGRGRRCNEGFPKANRNCAYVERRATDKGYADLAQALKLNPETCCAYLVQGGVLREEGDKAVARFAFGRVRELNPYTYGWKKYPRNEE